MTNRWHRNGLSIHPVQQTHLTNTINLVISRFDERLNDFHFARLLVIVPQVNLTSVNETNLSLSLARALRAGSNRTLTVVRPPGKSHSLFEYLGISFAISWFVYSSDHSHSKSDPPSATSLANKMTSNSEVISLHFQTWEEHSMIWYFNDEQSVISHFLYQQLQSHT